MLIEYGIYFKFLFKYKLNNISYMWKSKFKMYEK